jgi:hypothetical protein
MDKQLELMEDEARRRRAQRQAESRRRAREAAALTDPQSRMRAEMLERQRQTEKENGVRRRDRRVAYTPPDYTAPQADDYLRKEWRGAKK